MSLWQDALVAAAAFIRTQAGNPSQQALVDAIADAVLLLPQPEPSNLPYDGGPAFGALMEPGETGLSIRDWFACYAIEGTSGTGLDPIHLSDRAYDIADAMLVERAKPIPAPLTPP